MQRNQKRSQNKPKSGLSQPRSRAPRKQRPRDSSRGGPSGGNFSTTSTVQTVGAAIGRSAPTAYFKRGGLAQKTTDQDFAGSERISGCDLYSQAIVSNDTNTGGFPSNTYWQDITPSSISSRLQAIEEMYQWNAIRSLKLHYSTQVGSNTAFSVAIGVSTDSDLPAAFSAPTQQQIMELQPAMLVPAWGMASCEIKMRGTKLYESYLSSEGKENRIQAVIAAAFSALGTGTATPIGQLWLEYVIDFYQQTPLLSSVDLFTTGKACPRCHQRVLVDPRLERKYLTAPHKGQNSQVSDERKLPSSTEPDSPVLVSGLSTPGRLQDRLEQSTAAVRSAHGARASSTKGGY